MPTLEEAANTFAKDVLAQNLAGMLMTFTPEGMMKAMALQGQMQARAAAALAAGQPAPAPATSYTLDMKGPEGDDEVVQLNLASADGTAEMITRWREITGAWKVTDFSLGRVVDNDGNPVDLTGGATPAAT